MNFPDKELGTILYCGLLQIRELAGINDCKMCYIEANHLHNIPAILGEKSIPMLRSYFEIERPEYIRKATTPPIKYVLDSWSIIEQFLSEEK